MKIIYKFAQSEMTEEQESNFVEKLFDKHYDEVLKQDFKAKLSKSYGVDRETEISEESGKSPKFKYFIFGASAAAAVFAFIFVFMPLFDTSNGFDPKLYAQDLIVIEKMDVKRGKTAPSQDQYDVVEAYNNGRWSEVLSKFDKMEELTSENAYHQGLILLELGEFDKSIKSFTSIPDANEFKFTTELKYFLAIAYICNGEVEKAKPLLETVNRSGWKSEETQKLLENL